VTATREHHRVGTSTVLRMNAGRIQRAIMRTSSYPPFRWIYTASYGALLLWLLVRLRRFPEIQLMELREPRKDHCFGSSDLDVRAQTSRLSATEYFALCDRLANVLRPRKRWMRILDFHLVGPAEMYLQRRLGMTSFGDSRWIRLLGAKSRPAVSPLRVPNASLCRAMYEYGYVCQELFQRSFDLHSTRSLYRRLTRIDDEFRAMERSLDEASSELRRRVMSVAHSITTQGRLRIAQPHEIESAFAMATWELDSIARSSAAPSEAASHFVPVEQTFPLENRAEAVASCCVAIKDLCNQNSNTLRSAVMGGLPGTGFDYRLYLIARDDRSADELGGLIRSVRSIYMNANSSERIPSRYLRLRHPTVLTPAMWRASSRWYHALRPVEEYYLLQRQGVVLWGEDMRAELEPPTTSAVVYSAAIAATDLRHIIWESVHDRRPKQLADALIGRIPALWLLLAKSRIAVTSREALCACAASGFFNVEILQELRERLAGTSPGNLPQTDDPIWKPALESASVWLEEIVEIAAARIERPAEIPDEPRRLSETWS
jgi:hypothetical protein